MEALCFGCIGHRSSVWRVEAHQLCTWYVYNSWSILPNCTIGSYYSGSSNWGFHPVLLIICIVGLVALLGLISEFTVFRPLRSTSDTTLMVGSFALGFILQNLLVLFMVEDQSDRSLDRFKFKCRLMDGVSIPRLQFFIIITTILLMGLLVLFLKKTNGVYT